MASSAVMICWTVVALSWSTLLSFRCSGSRSTLAIISRSTLPPPVAENSRVCWRLAHSWVMRSMSSAKPRSSMRSASSSTSTSTPLSLRLPALRCSISRPGVAISRSGCLRSNAACSLKSSPPVTRPALMKVYWEKRSTSLRICWASSRVGSRISERTSVRCFELASPSRRLSSGSRKAAVLPLPVCAVTRRSRPSSAGGMAACCTGVGSVKFSSATALSRRSCRANWENTGAYLGTENRKQPHRLPVVGAKERI